jgi:hypothetical protein
MREKHDYLVKFSKVKQKNTLVKSFRLQVKNKQMKNSQFRKVEYPE